MLILYYSKLRNPTKKEETEKSGKVKHSIIQILDVNEKQVVELLQSMDNEVTQAYIRKSTGIPGSTLSKLMLRLEERNIIERRSEGKTKWVRLKEWVFD